MSQTVQPDATPAAPEAAAVAPAGQGETDLTSGIYSLEDVPEGIRDQVAPLLKQWDGNVTREFQKRAEMWKPYDELGLRDVDPGELSQLLEFRNIASDDEMFRNWVEHAYQELGLGGAEAPAGEGEGEGDQPQYLTQEQLEQHLAQREAQAEQERKEQEIHDQVAREARETLDELLKGYDGDNKAEIEELIAFFAMQNPEEGAGTADLLRAGHAKWQQMIGAAKSDAIDQKLAQPKPAETGGAPQSEPKKAATVEEAGARLKERLRAQRGV